MFDADKTRMIGLPYGEKTMRMLSRFHLIPEGYGQTRTEILYQYRASTHWRAIKKYTKHRRIIKTIKSEPEYSQNWTMLANRARRGSDFTVEECARQDKVNNTVSMEWWMCSTCDACIPTTDVPQ